MTQTNSLSQAAWLLKTVTRYGIGPTRRCLALVFYIEIFALKVSLFRFKLQKLPTITGVSFTKN